jgi:hypothetical protein
MDIALWIIVAVGIAGFFTWQVVAFRAFSRAMRAHRSGESIEGLQRRFRRAGFFSICWAVAAVAAIYALQRS